MQAPETPNPTTRTRAPPDPFPASPPLPLYPVSAPLLSYARLLGIAGVMLIPL